MKRSCIKSRAEKIKMTLIMSRVVLTGVLFYALILIWTKDVNLISWVKNTVAKILPINEQHEQSNNLSCLTIDLRPNESKQTVKFIKRDKSISYYLTIPIKNSGDTSISDFSILEIKSKVKNKDTDTFDFLDLFDKNKSDIPKVILPNQNFNTSLFWMSFILKEGYSHKTLYGLDNKDYILIHRQLLHPDNWIQYKFSYTSNDRRWLYEFKFKFDPKMSEQKILKGTWPIILVNQDLKEIK